MKFVYILRSLSVEERYYVGLTENVEARLKRHNVGGVPHTAKYGPWEMKTFVGFADEAQAVAFEKYLKTASGRAFSRKRL